MVFHCVELAFGIANAVPHNGILGTVEWDPLGGLTTQVHIKSLKAKNYL